MQNTLIGFADAKPSESIQPHPDPGIVVAALFIATPDGAPIDPPVIQYKGGRQRNKPARARQLREWLDQQQDSGLRIAGFCTVSTQKEAATMGLSLIEELPDTSVEEHRSGYRLQFPRHHVDFAQAVALQYYWFTMQMAALRAATLMPDGPRNLELRLDRFPSARISGSAPGVPLPPTDGIRFLNFVDRSSPTAISIRAENEEMDMQLMFGTIDWWKPSSEDEWRRGRTHPNFALPDWLAVAAMAEEFPDEFVQTFDDAVLGVETVEELKTLHGTFKEHDIWTFGRSAAHIRGQEQNWQVPDPAREFILDRARGT